MVSENQIGALIFGLCVTICAAWAVPSSTELNEYDRLCTIDIIELSPDEITVVYTGIDLVSETIDIKNFENYSKKRPKHENFYIYSFDFIAETGQLKHVKLIDPVYTEVDIETRRLTIYV